MKIKSMLILLFVLSGCSSSTINPVILKQQEILKLKSEVLDGVYPLIEESRRTVTFDGKQQQAALVIKEITLSNNNRSSLVIFNMVVGDEMVGELYCFMIKNEYLWQLVEISYIKPDKIDKMIKIQSTFNGEL